VPKPAVFVNPDGKKMLMSEWMYSTQVDLDRVGNTYSIITEVDGTGKPRALQLCSHRDVTVKVKKGVVTYRIGGTDYDSSEVHHEKQFTVAGMAVGLSPIAHAAWSLGIYQTAADFAIEWFGNGGTVPTAHLKNTEKIVDPASADIVKDRFKLAVEGRDLFVTGKDWTYSTINAASADAKFLESMTMTERDAARYFGVPADMIDAPGQGSSITYANITQRNLQLLIMHINPALRRREEALSAWMPAPRFAKFNRGALLEMDPQTKSSVLIAEMAGRLTAPSEARGLLDRAPFTDEQLAEFEALFPSRTESGPKQT
jgi:HK97 family phage portal protein